MKKLFALIVIMAFTALGFNTAIVEAVGVGGSIDVDGAVAETEPLIWLCDSRLMFDDNIQPGRMTDGGDILFERMNNYAFEGEQIQWSLLVCDKNGIGKIEHVYVTVGDTQGEENDEEVNCMLDHILPGDEELDEDCNARFGQEEWNYPGEEGSPGWDNLCAYYTCLFTVETPESYHMDNEYFVTAEVCDLTDNCNTMDEHEFWYFNPVVALTIDLATVYEGEESDSLILFNEGDPIAPGTTAYSNTVLVGNGADPDSGVRLDMFITGTDFYDSSSSGAKCPTTNQLALGDGDSDCDVGSEFGGSDGYTDPFCYFATHGAYSTGDFIMSDGRADAEGYVGIMHGDGNAFNPTALYDNAEIIQAGPMNYDYYQANIISPGAEMAITFRLNLPAPCVGDFDTGNIYFWGEAI